MLTIGLKSLYRSVGGAIALTIASASTPVCAQTPPALVDPVCGAPGVDDFPGLRTIAVSNSPGLHIEQSTLVAGTLSAGRIFSYGGAIADSRFNECDGEGRPATTGGGDKRAPTQPRMTRVSGPEASSCSGCHAQPRTGGSGDFVANTFNGAEEMDPVVYSVSPDGVNERNTTGMFGSGFIELLAREMTGDLKRQSASWTTSAKYADGWKTFTTKGITFDAYFVNKQITDSRGIDTDLIVRPFGAGGTKVSLREFNVGALNRHHGMQPEEAYDIYKGDPDYDQDGIQREMTIGDVTALTIWSAMLAMPARQMPSYAADDPAEMQASYEGEQIFKQVGCASCHAAEMTLKSNVFCEPSPYNPPGIFNDTSQSVCVALQNLPGVPAKQKLHESPNKVYTLNTYTDLKRHHMCDDPSYPGAIRELCNEEFPQGRPSQDGYPGQEFFLTADLWQVAESAPYGHDGRYNSMHSVILAHAGEARTSRDAYAALSRGDHLKVVKFLRTLRIQDQNIRLHDG